MEKLNVLAAVRQGARLWFCGKATIGLQKKVRKAGAVVGPARGHSGAATA